ncbi:MAG: hypothetical protein L0196_05200 [candidate division Zixibacteria bacterium]|nr:hypothetical protein [candidate division Zixibacteria bacterium]
MSKFLDKYILSNVEGGEGICHIVTIPVPVVRDIPTENTAEKRPKRRFRHPAVSARAVPAKSLRNAAEGKNNAAAPKASKDFSKSGNRKLADVVLSNKDSKERMHNKVTEKEVL